ncbi:MAG: ABC transporter substrate-binding protein [Spirochaetaceae bacterium]|jgi:raffinose/stachyose/melibiose transport system substrate-binding protein|nr:ABC transporter substrate-binding protein [Spirochaetaceae bacterium]
MKKIAVCAFVFLAAMVALTGCAKDSGKGSVYILQFKPEIASQWEQAGKQYTAATGVQVKVVTAASGTYEQTLRAEISKSAPPTLFQVNGPVGYQNWKDYTLDLKGTAWYSWLSDKSLAITGDDGGVYAIPYTVEAYGIIYNDAILRRYFALPGKAVGISSAAEITSFAVLKAVAEDIQKNKAALGVSGAFASTSFAPGEDWRWQTHLLDVPLYFEYRDKNATSLAAIDFTYAPNYKNIFDLYINYAASEKPLLGNVTVDMSMAEFALGKAVFVQNGYWAWGQISSTQGNVVQAEDVKFLPIYIGAPGEEQQGINIGTEAYWSINSRASKANQDATIAFVEWLFNTPEGKALAIGQFDYSVPLSTFTEADRANVTNPLTREMFRYLANGSLTSVSWVPQNDIPGQDFKNELGANLYQYALGTKAWDALVAEAKASWASEAGALGRK